MLKSTQTLAQCYTDAMRKHLDATRPNRIAAGKMSTLMRESGLSTLDLAQIHGRALITLSSDHDFMHTRNGKGKRAAVFFNETLSGPNALSRPDGKFPPHGHHHSAALALSNRKLLHEISRRKASEQTLKTNRACYQSLLVQSQTTQRKLRELAHQMLSTQEDERCQISRELHDEVVQTLVGISVQLASLSRATNVGAEALKLKIANTQRLVEKSVSAVHQFARELRPSVLDDLGLIPALRAYMKPFVARKKIQIEFIAVASVETLDDNKRTVLYRVAQEALTNIARHAHATVVTVSIIEIRDMIRMELNDNGKAFNVTKTLSGKTNQRLGLLGMRERVEMVGGTLTLKSSPGQGTTVRADIPFASLPHP